MVAAGCGPIGVELTGLKFAETNRTERSETLAELLSVDGHGQLWWT
jgi:hypothetical protein